MTLLTLNFFKGQTISYYSNLQILPCISLLALHHSDIVWYVTLFNAAASLPDSYLVMLWVTIHYLSTALVGLSLVYGVILSFFRLLHKYPPALLFVLTALPILQSFIPVSILALCLLT